MVRRVTPLVGSVLAGMFALSACGGGASAGGGEGPVTLRVAAYLPETHPGSTSGDQYFLEQATELSDGRIEFDFYPAEQLGKSSDFIDLVQAGTADIAMVSPAYVPDKLPISSVGELPAMFDSSCEGSAAFHKLTRPGEYLYETEFAPVGIRPLFGTMTVPYEVFTVSKPLDNLEAVEGLRLKTAGGAADNTARLLGSVPVQLSNADVYTALERGTIDGRYGPYEYQPAVNSEDLLQHGTEGANVAAFSMTASINEQKWKTLPEDVQDVLIEAGELTVEHYCAEADKNDELVRDQLEADHGWTIYELDEDERARWQETMAPTHDQWANNLDEHRNDTAASDALDAFRAAVEDGA